MKKLIAILFVAFCLTVGAYAAFCKDRNGTKFCGETCESSAGSCKCTGACTGDEIDAVLKDAS